MFRLSRLSSASHPKYTILIATHIMPEMYLLSGGCNLVDLASSQEIRKVRDFSKSFDTFGVPAGSHCYNALRACPEKKDSCGIYGLAGIGSNACCDAFKDGFQRASSRVA